MASFLFCPQCASRLEYRTMGGFERGLCPDTACGYTNWDNPTPVVAAVVEYDGGLILARNVAWRPGAFALITGFLEKNEDPAEAVAREVNEELGLQVVQPPAFIGHYTFERMNQLIIAYHVKAEGEVVLNEELAEWRYVRFDRAKYWPAATGLALRDWLRSQGYDPQSSGPLNARPEPPAA